MAFTVVTSAQVRSDDGWTNTEVKAAHTEWGAVVADPEADVTVLPPHTALALVKWLSKHPAVADAQDEQKRADYHEGYSDAKNEAMYRYEAK